MPAAPFPRPAAAILALLLVVGCGDDPTAPDLGLLVGDWEATAMRFTSEADPEKTIDIVAEGGRFTLNVQPSGQYTAILAIPGFAPQTEIGLISVSGSTITLEVQFSPTGEVRTDTGTYSVSTEILQITAKSVFNFGDGPEDSTLQTTFQRQPEA